MPAAAVTVLSVCTLVLAAVGWAGSTPAAALPSSPTVQSSVRTLAAAQDLVSAHRGGTEWSRPQSLKQFEQAAAHGLRDLEFDVRYSRDRVPLVSHDEVSRCAPRGVQNVLAETAQACGLFPLSDLLDLAKRYPRVILRVESKVYKGQSTAGQRRDAQQLALDLKGAGLVTRSVIASFSYARVTDVIKDVDPGFAVQALVQTADPSNIRAAAEAGADEYGFNARSGASKWVLTFAKRHGLKPTPWYSKEVTEPSNAYPILIALGASKIVTDYPVAAVKQIRTAKCKSTWIDTRDSQIMNATVPPGQSTLRTMVGKNKMVRNQKNLSDGVRLRVTVKSQPAKGAVLIAPVNGDPRDASAVKLTGLTSYEVTSNPGDKGAIEVTSRAKQALKIKIDVLGYWVMKCS